MAMYPTITSVRDLLLSVAAPNKSAGGTGTGIGRTDHHDPFVDTLLALPFPSPTSSVSTSSSITSTAADSPSTSRSAPHAGHTRMLDCSLDSQPQPQPQPQPRKQAPVLPILPLFPIPIDSLFPTAVTTPVSSAPPVAPSTPQRSRSQPRTHSSTAPKQSHHDHGKRRTSLGDTTARTDSRPRVIVHPIQFSSTRLDTVTEHIFCSLLKADKQPCTISELESRLGILPTPRSPTTATAVSPSTLTPSPATVHYSIKSPTTPVTRPPIHPPTPPATPPLAPAQPTTTPMDPDSDSDYHHPHSSRRKMHRQLESAIAAYLLGIELHLPNHPAPNTSWSIPSPSAHVSDQPANHWRHLDRLKRQSSPFITDISILLSRPFPTPVPASIAPPLSTCSINDLIPPAARLPTTLATRALHAPPSAIPVHLFLDHSNILHGGRKLLASTYASLPCALSPTTQVHLDAYHLNWLLVDVLLPHIIQPPGHALHVVKRVAVMSALDTDTHADDHSLDLIRHGAWQVHTLRRTHAGHEQFVDELLQCCMAESMLDHHPAPTGGAPPPVMVLLSGDGRCAHHTAGFPTHVARAVRRGWTVVVVAFSASLSGVFSRMVKVVDRQREVGGEEGEARVGRLWVVTLDGEVARVMRVVE